MLEAFRILEEDKGIKKEDIIDAVVEASFRLSQTLWSIRQRSY